MTLLQSRLLSCIRQHQQANGGLSPSYEEMSASLGLKSKSGIHRLLVALERQGSIVRGPGRRRDIHIVESLPDLSGVPTVALQAEIKRREAVAP